MQLNRHLLTLARTPSLTRAGLALALGASPMLASASLTVTYVPYSGDGVPLSPAVLGLMAVVVGALALWALKSRRVRQGGVLVLGLAIGLGGLVFKKNAQATPTINHYDLTGNSFVDSGWDAAQIDELTNATGQTIVLTSVTDSNGPGYIANNSTCKVGVVLKPGEACQVKHAT